MITRVVLAVAVLLLAAPATAQTGRASTPGGMTGLGIGGSSSTFPPVPNGAGVLDSGFDRQERQLANYADCIVGHDPIGSGNYLRRSFDRDEGKQFRKLQASAWPCYVGFYGRQYFEDSRIRTAAIADAVRRRIARQGHL